jgi:hypothetical protein
MEKQLYPDTPEMESEQMIAATAFKTEEQNIKKYFSEQENFDMKKQFFANASKIRAAHAVFIKAREAYAEAIKEPEKDNKYLMNCLDTGYVEVLEDVYLIDDQDNGFMLTYDRKGELLTSRRLAPEEKQTRIKN